VESKTESAVPGNMRFMDTPHLLKLKTNDSIGIAPAAVSAAAPHGGHWSGFGGSERTGVVGAGSKSLRRRRVELDLDHTSGILSASMVQRTLCAQPTETMMSMVQISTIRSSFLEWRCAVLSDFLLAY
jgi:hypothetical protein